VTYDKNTPIAGKGSGDPIKIVDWAIKNGAVGHADLKQYVNTVYTLAPKLGLNPDVVIGQSHLETDGWKSEWWKNRRNPAGIGITGDPDQNNQSATFTGETAALAHLVHLYLYNQGEDLPDFLDAKMDPRWDNAVKAGYAGVAHDLDDLNQRWAIDPEDAYGEKIAGRMNQMVTAGLIGQGTGGSDMPFKKPYVILVAGHRSTRDGGNPTERSYTDDLAKAYCDVFRAAGYKADWYQRDLDKDSLPDMTEGGLDTVALGVAKAIANADAELVLMYDLHFDGANSVVHAIPPDCVGLRTAYAGGAPAVDTAVNNTLDTNLAAEISAELASALGLGIYPARRLGIKGVMSERDTRVGSQGSRLAMHAASAPYRMKSARLVIEHAGYDQTTKIADWANKSAKAALRATNRVLEARGGPIGEEPGGGEEPIPDPTEFGPIGPTPSLQPYVAAGTLIKAPPAVVVGEEGEYVYVGHRVKAIRNTPRRQGSHADSPKVGVDVVEGTTFIVLFAHRTSDGSWWYITGWWSHFPVTDTEVVSEVAE
jgi:hypothetical protein